MGRGETRPRATIRLAIQDIQKKITAGKRSPKFSLSCIPSVHRLNWRSKSFPERHLRRVDGASGLSHQSTFIYPSTSMGEAPALQPENQFLLLLVAQSKSQALQNGDDTCMPRKRPATCGKGLRTMSGGQAENAKPWNSAPANAYIPEARAPGHLPSPTSFTLRLSSMSQNYLPFTPRPASL